MNLEVNYHTPIQQINQQPGHIGQQIQRDEPTLTRKVCAATAGILSGSATAIGYLVIAAIVTSETQRSNPSMMTGIFIGAVVSGQVVGRIVNDKILKNGNERS